MRRDTNHHFDFVVFHELIELIELIVELIDLYDLHDPDNRDLQYEHDQHHLLVFHDKHPTAGVLPG
jgi:hypothetical protein